MATNSWSSIQLRIVKTIKDLNRSLKVLTPNEKKKRIKDTIPEDQLNEKSKNEIEKKKLKNMEKIWKK